MLFINTIEPGLYPGKWNNWRGLLLSGQSGDLRHPDIGIFNSRVDNVSYHIGSDNTHGLKARVKFVETLKSADEPTKIVPNKSDLAATAKAIDDTMAVMNLPYPDGMGFAEVTFEGLVNELASIGSLVELEALGALNRILGLADAVYASMQVLGVGSLYLPASVRDLIANDVARHTLERSINALHAQAKAAAEAAVGSSKQVGIYQTDADYTLASISIKLSADISDLVRLNPTSVKYPVIPKGSKVRYYA